MLDLFHDKDIKGEQTESGKELASSRSFREEGSLISGSDIAYRDPLQKLTVNKDSPIWGARRWRW